MSASHRVRCPARSVVAAGATFALWGLGGCGLIPTVPDVPFSSIIVFGDSLSDTGNIGLEIGLLLPAPPYAIGRFSNGSVWIEHVARHFGLPVMASYLGGTNYAQGGAETGMGFAQFEGIQAGANILEQIALYPGTPDGNELFVVWGGANDLFNALDGESDTTPEDSANNVAAAIMTLYGRGGRRFLVANLPDLGRTPKYQSSARQAAATQATTTFNAWLAAWLDAFDGLRDIRIVRMDVFAQINAFLDNPTNGITNTTDPAWSAFILGFPGGGTLAANPDTYAFWDLVHPTRVSHQRVGEGAIALLEAQGFAPPGGPRLSIGALAPPPPFAFWLAYLSNLARMIAG